MAHRRLAKALFLARAPLPGASSISANIRAIMAPSRPFSLLFALSAAASGALLFALGAADAAPAADAGTEKDRIKSRNRRIAGLHSPSHSMSDCPSYGCVMLPRDVAFDEDAKGALEAIRALSAAAATDDDADAEAAGAEPDAGAEGDDRHKGYASSSAEAFGRLVSAGNARAATLTLMGYKGGAMDGQINQDRSFVLSPYVLGSSSSSSNPQEAPSGGGGEGVNSRLLGVFDGHAKLGELVSQHAVEALPGLLASKLEALDAEAEREEEGDDGGGGGDDSEGDDSEEGGGDASSRQDSIKRILAETFVELDRTAPAQNGGGCTASVVLQLGDDVYVANAGDSRSFLAAYVPPAPGAGAEGGEDAGKRPEKAEEEAEEGEGGTVQILYATREDKPHLPDEKERVESNGGTVMIPPPERLAAGASSRVMYVDSATGAQYGLAMSRSIGDWDAGKFGVVPDPLVERFRLTELAAEAARKASSTEEGGCEADGAAEAEVDESGEPVVVAPSSSSADGERTCSPRTVDPSSVRLFAVSATDGLLDYVSPDLIVRHVARGLYESGADKGGGDSDGSDGGTRVGAAARGGPHPLTACEDLVATAAGGWHRAKNGRYRDDIAIAVSRLDDA